MKGTMQKMWDFGKGVAQKGLQGKPQNLQVSDFEWGQNAWGNLGDTQGLEPTLVPTFPTHLEKDPPCETVSEGSSPLVRSC